MFDPIGAQDSGWSAHLVPIPSICDHGTIKRKGGNAVWFDRLGQNRSRPGGWLAHLNLASFCD